ncbi:MAG: GAF domain-containing sensor histidine kinase, partial [Bacteroidales bacterium]|nr:GAF domain-containing sensor histidine kinase [Bacteroidales bacterium]
DYIRAEISSLIDTRNFFLALYDEDTNSLSLPYFKDEKDTFDRFPAEKTMSALVIETKESMLLSREKLMQLIDAGTIKAVGSIPHVWLGIPLMVEGKVIGVMVLQNYQDVDAIREEHRQLLQVISPQITLSIVRKQAEERLRRSEQELRDANLTKDRFFNIIAHDLKNPFNAIIGFSTLLCDEWSDFDDVDKITMVQAIRQSSEGAYELLMNLLEWSRLRVGTIDYHPDMVDINNVVERSISLLKSNADEKNIHLTFEPCESHQVLFDDNMLRTIIRNLLSNAIKFTHGFGVINITTFFDPNYPAMLRFSIADSGIGIAPEKIKSLFSLTETSSTSGTNGETGTGLGLILCKEFIDKNNGKIWVESTLGTGSSFHMAIPIYEAARKSSSG